jgi:hypothetical protein
MSFLAGWMLNPWLFAAGGLLVAAPILIHLLNRRRLRVIDWAAMDFLLEAERRNRRRVQIEELILLTLRCLAMLLAGLFVARPFLPSQITRRFFRADRTERIVLLDDSPSMDAVVAGNSPFRAAKRRIAEFVTALAEQGGGDSITLCLTSRPDRPLVRDAVVDSSSAPGLNAEIDTLPPSDVPARLDRAFVALRGMAQNRSERINRVAYVLSDLRRVDWSSDEAQGASHDEKNSAAGSLTALAEELAGCFVMDFGAGVESNVSIDSITPEDKALLAGVKTRFQVTIRNFTPETLRDVPVKFTAGGALPMTAGIASIPPGGTGTAAFSFTFPSMTVDTDIVSPVEMSAQLEPPPGDQLGADNVRHYAARVRAGIPTLIVDGDPSGEFGRAESFFLQRALAPPGANRSGISVQVASDSELATLPLDEFQVIALCNVFQLDDARIKALERWVQSGGGLVVFPGGQIDQRFYTERLHRGGQGLLPRPYQSIAGDDTEQTSVGFAVADPEHPSLRAFSGDAAPLLESTKVFQWWTVPATGEGTVLLRFTDAERSPAMLERRFGDGRVIQFCLPADVDWTNWPEDPSYLILLQELNRHLAQTAALSGQLTVGEPWSESIDLSRYRPEATLTRPGGATSTVLADANVRSGSPSQWSLTVPDTAARGFYRLDLSTAEGQTQPLLAAVNLPVTESDLGRMDAASLRSAWQKAPVELVDAAPLVSLTAEAGRGELWFPALMLLIAVLFTEQGLAWWFGRRRW